MVPVAMRAVMMGLWTTFKRKWRTQTRVRRAKAVTRVRRAKTVTRVANFELAARVVAFESETFAISGR